MFKKTDSTVRMFSYADDQPTEGKGVLIPRAKTKSTSYPKHTFSPNSVTKDTRGSNLKSIVSVLSLCALALLGSVGYDMAANSNLMASPIVTVVDPYTKDTTTLDYGPQLALSSSNFFVETREAFIEEGLSFVEIDLSKQQLLFFKKGVLVQSTEILGIGEKGSWWETPAGLYKVEKKDKQSFSNFGQAYLPWQLTFEGNYLIHGWPTYPDGSDVMNDFKGGGVRLDTSIAKALYESVQVGTLVLVHDADNERDDFVYEPQVPEIDTPHYFIADVDNGTVLAASDIDALAPIASLTKLMTAVVAAESINLDGRINVLSSTFVTSLIPRLSERSSVSVYSLLQLLLVESSNEAAETIAGEIGREEFIEAMNAKARQLGMMNTHFADPSGLSPDNVSSLGDLFKLTQYINENRSFIFEITADKELSSAYVGGEFNNLVNFNEVKNMESFSGGKVGETTAAGQTSISLHKLYFKDKERTLAVVLLGSDSRVDDIEVLISYIQNQFSH